MSNDQQEQVEKAAVNGESLIELGDRDPNAAVVAALSMLLNSEPTILLDAIIAAFSFARDAALRPKDRYHTVIVPDGAVAVLTTVDSFEEFLAVWREAYQQRAAQIFGFYKGEVILPSQGGDCMVTSGGSFPLFVKASDTAVDLKGYLGPHPTATKATPVPADTYPTNESDEEGLDQEEEEDIDEEVDEE